VGQVLSHAHVSVVERSVSGGNHRLTTTYGNWRNVMLMHKGKPFVIHDTRNTRKVVRMKSTHCSVIRVWQDFHLLHVSHSEYVVGGVQT